MKPRTLLSPPAIGVLLGFLVGLASHLHDLISSQFIRYGMFRSAALGLRDSLNKWVLLCVTISFALWIVPPLCLCVAKGTQRLLFSNIVDFSVKNEDSLRRVILVFAGCLLLGWAVNHHWLPHKFAPVSLLVDLGILFLAVLSGWAGLKIRSFRPLRTGACLLLFLCLLNLGLFIDGKMNPPAGPNVLLIVVDTLRADHLGCYGYGRDTTPNIDALSSDSLVFKNAISSAPWTTPSVGTMMTGQYPAVLGITDKPAVLDEWLLTIAELFRENGYETSGIISHCYIASNLGFAQGFQSYDEENDKGHGHVSSPSVTEKAVSFITRHKSGPFFLFLHYFDPHFDYILHEPYNFYPDYDGLLFSGQPIDELLLLGPRMTESDIRFLKALYDSEIRFTDEHIGRFLNKLKELQIYDDALIVLTADHGEEFLERGHGWIGHANTLYQEQIHVPLILKLPGAKRHRVINEFVSLTDLYPSIASFAGVPIPGEYSYPGVAAGPDGEILEERTIISETRLFMTAREQRKSDVHSAIDRGWKLVVDRRLGVTELFNLEKDPAEMDNVVKENEKIRQAMEESLREWETRIGVAGIAEAAEEPGFTNEQIRRLKSLGYVH